jgi:hypothetical protein
MKKSGGAMENENNQTSNSSLSAIKVLAGCLIAGVIFILFHAAPDFTKEYWLRFFSIVSVALLVAGSSLISGVLLGFLFAIPRTHQQEGSSAVQQRGDDTGEEKKVVYEDNTNLEQISDWLTKILVGVGLTQISDIPVALERYANYIGPSLSYYKESGNGKVFSIALLLFFLINGFLISYLWTRIYFRGALSDSVSHLIKKFEKDVDINAKAWRLYQQLLSPAKDSAPPTQKEINEIIASASTNMKAQIFWAAKSVRSDNWQNPCDKIKVERMIPIFRALIAADPDGKYHRNHGELGFALKDKKNPDCSGALAELTEAIKLRGDFKATGGSPFYEFVRAQCRIHLDEAYNNEKPSDENTKQAILSDLKITFSNPETNALIKRDTQEDCINKWMTLNGEKYPC